MKFLQPNSALYVSPTLCTTVGLILVILPALMSVLLLLASMGKPGYLPKTLEQKIAAVGGLAGLGYAAAALFWHYYAGFIYSRGLAILIYSGWKILGGMFAAMLISILSPRKPRVIAGISVGLLIAFSSEIIIGYSTGRSLAALLFPSMSIGLLIGVSIYGYVSLRFDPRDGTQQLERGNQETTTAASTGQG